MRLLSVFLHGRAWRNGWRLAVVLVVALSSAYSYADTLRVATYNSLDFRGAQDAARYPYFQTALRAADPDVVMMQEMNSEAAMDGILSNVLVPIHNDFVAADFMTGRDTQNSFYYRSSKVALVSQRAIATDLRNIGEYIVRPLSADTSRRFIFYSAHLKADNTAPAAQQRLSEANTMRGVTNALPAGSLFIMGGDFNIYTSTEDCYQALLSDSVSTSGKFNDPIDMPGSWHDNVSFEGIHTQSTRTTDLGDGGATGGLDDRFDILLCSNAFLATSGPHVVAQTYKAFGNDGHHLNNSINDGINYAVPDSVANALYRASDHLPVMVDIAYGTSAVTGAISLPESYRVLNCYPNPFNSMLTVDVGALRGQGSLKVFNLVGRQVMVRHLGNSDGHNLTVPLDFSTLGSGDYFIRLESPNRTDVAKVSLIR